MRLMQYQYSCELVSCMDDVKIKVTRLTPIADSFDPYHTHTDTHTQCSSSSLPSACLTMGLHKSSPSRSVSYQICCSCNVQILCSQIIFHVVHPGLCLSSSASLALDEAM